MGESDGVSEATLRELLASGAVRGVIVVGESSGWAVQVEIGTRRRVLKSARAPVRWWKSMDRLTRWLREELGVVEWSVDARHYHPGQKSV